LEVACRNGGCNVDLFSIRYVQCTPDEEYTEEYSCPGCNEQKRLDVLVVPEKTHNPGVRPDTRLSQYELCDQKLIVVLWLVAAGDNSSSKQIVLHHSRILCRDILRNTRS